VDRLNPSDKRSKEINFRMSQILSSFESTGIFTMPHPGKKLTQSYELNNLDDDFIATAKEFVRFIFSKEVLRHTKKVRGVPVTGNTFGKFIHHWSRYFTSSEVPKMQDIMQTTIEIQLRIALQSSLEYFQTTMDAYFTKYPNGVENGQLEEQLGEVKSTSFNIFQELCEVKRSPSTSLMNEPAFNEQVQDSREHYVSINLIRRDFAHNLELLVKEKENVQQTILSSESQLKSIQEQCSREQAEFEANFARIKEDGERQIVQLKREQEQRLEQLILQLEAQAKRLAEERAEQARRLEQLRQQEELLAQQRAQELERLNSRSRAWRKRCSIT